MAGCDGDGRGASQTTPRPTSTATSPEPIITSPAPTSVGSEQTSTQTQSPSGSPGQSRPRSLQELEKLAREELQPGHVAYNPPSKTRVGEILHLTVHVRRDSATPDPNFTALPGKVRVEPLPVGTDMQATLSGAAFTITPTTRKSQPLYEDFATWRWDVQPKSPGAQVLILELAVEYNGKTLKTVTFERHINVDVAGRASPIRRFVQNMDLASLTTTLLGALILALSGFLARRAQKAWSRRREEARSTTGQTAAPPADPDTESQVIDLNASDAQVNVPKRRTAPEGVEDKHSEKR
jgi:hypothetical protein